MSGGPKRDTHLTEMARVSPVVSLDPPHRHFRSARRASVSAGTELAPAVDEEEVSAGMQSAPLPLLLASKTSAPMLCSRSSSKPVARRAASRALALCTWAEAAAVPLGDRLAARLPLVWLGFLGFSW
jgi:hypothetical protein